MVVKYRCAKLYSSRLKVFFLVGARIGQDTLFSFFDHHLPYAAVQILFFFQPAQTNFKFCELFKIEPQMKSNAFFQIFLNVSCFMSLSWGQQII